MPKRFTHVVTMLSPGVTVDYINSDGLMGGKEHYKNTRSLPPDIRDKVKQLMWVPQDDAELRDGVGIRIGKGIFWIQGD